MTETEKKEVELAFDNGKKIVYRDAWIKRWSLVRVPHWNWSIKEYRILVEVENKRQIPDRMPVTRVYLMNGQYYFIEDESSESMNSVSEMRRTFDNFETRVDLKFGEIDTILDNILKSTLVKNEISGITSNVDNLKTKVSEIMDNMKIEEAYRQGGDDKLLKEMTLFKDTIVKKVNRYEDILEKVEYISEFVKNFDENQKSLKSNDTIIKGRIRCDSIQPLSIQTPLDGGYATDTYGNLRHSNNSKYSNFKLSSYDGEKNLVYNWETGDVTLSGNLTTYKTISANAIDAKGTINRIFDLNIIELSQTEAGWSKKFFSPKTSSNNPDTKNDFFVEVNTFTLFPDGTETYHVYCQETATNIADGTKFIRSWISDKLMKSTEENTKLWTDWKQTN